MAKKAIVGEKVGMTQVWDAHNRAIPVTVLRVTRCHVAVVMIHCSAGFCPTPCPAGTCQ